MNTTNTKWNDKQKVLKDNEIEKRGLIEQEIKNAINNICPDCVFDSVVNERWGVGEALYDIFWWDIKIKDSLLIDELKGYTDILCLPYKINISEIAELQKIEGNLSKHTLYCVKETTGESRYWGKSKSRPHIDITTGNIHNVKRNECGDKIQQLVLARKDVNNHLGPKLDMWKGTINYNSLNSLACNIFMKTGVTKKNEICGIAMPKMCYYPAIDDVEAKEESFEEMLRKFLDNICKKR